MNKLERWIVRNPNKAAFIGGVTISVCTVAASFSGTLLAHMFMDHVDRKFGE